MPRAQKARGHKTVAPKYFMTKAVFTADEMN